MTNFEWLRKQCASDPRKATFIHLVSEGVDKGEAAEKAGYSGGTSDDPKQRRKAYLTAAGSILRQDRARHLLELYQRRQASGEQTEVVSREERRQVLSEIAREGSPNEQRQAITALNAMDKQDLDRREDGKHLTSGLRTQIQQAIARHGEDKVVEALTVLGFERLTYWPQAFEARIAKLERRHLEADDVGTSGPVTRPSSDGVGDSTDGRLPATGGHVAREVAERSADAGHVVRDRSRTKRRKVTTEPTQAELESMENFQRHIGLGS